MWLSLYHHISEV
uniref:Uncharacterized protein n=1 Tax=Anguilla anguilla TaxID=7936 RepID=A0A0E9VEP8_ANGAN